MSRFARAASALAASAAFALTAALTTALPAAAETLPLDGIVSRVGTALQLNGSPYRFTGYQIGLGSSPAHPLCTVYSDESVGPALLRAKQSSGANSVRVWMYQSYGGPTDWRRFDLIFSEARKAGVRVVATLTNHWGDCEPGDATGRAIRKSLPWYASGYRSLDTGYSASYRDFVRSMAERYRAEPALLAWQLVNEAAAESADGSCDELTARSALRSFSDDMVSIIRGAGDPHLVNLGSIANGQCGLSGSASFRHVHAGGLDLCEAHDYDPSRPVPGDAWNGLAVRIADCAAVGKPLFVGEAGIQRGIQADFSTGPVTSETLSRRATLFDGKLREQTAAGVVGFQVWQKAPAHGDGFTVFDGDPLEAVMMRHKPAEVAAPVVSEPLPVTTQTVLSGSTGGKGTTTLSLSTGAGPLSVRTSTSSPVSLTVSVLDAAGRVLTTQTGITPYDLSVTVPAGTQRLKVSGPRKVRFTLITTHIAP